MERAARRWLHRGRHLAAEHDAPAFSVGINHRDCGDQSLSVGVLRGMEELAGFRHFHHFSEIHHQNPLADMPHDGQIMRDE